LSTLGSFETFLLAVFLAGVIQVIAGFAGLGIIGNYFPSSVIKGMLAAIGITLILKEIPHAVGYDKDFMGDESFFQADGHNTLSEIYYAMGAINFGAVIIFILSILILLFIESKWLKKYEIFKFVPGALIVVVLGIFINLLFKQSYPAFYLMDIHAVSLPVASTVNEFFTFFKSPDWSQFGNYQVYLVAITIALVASLETLLSVEATDKIDPEKNHTPTNRELKAQGIGNIVTGLIGGLPITQVIVRSSANVNANAKSKLSAIMHAVLLALTVIFVPHVLNMIPLASLAAVLILVGYKLAKLSLFKKMFNLGWDQFLPFTTTIVAILFTDLLKGIAIGLAVSIFFILRKNFHNNFKEEKVVENENQTLTLTLSEEVTFLNKAAILNALQKLPSNSNLVIDGTNSKLIDYDVLELFNEFSTVTAKEKNITCELRNIPDMEKYVFQGSSH
jgi:MFS superfamily sulfate permease-like transporter